MRYDLTIGDRSFSVEIPPRLEFDPPLSRSELEKVLSASVATAVAPKLSPRLPEKRVERDESGHIARVVEVPAMSAADLAAGIGRRVAEHYVATLLDGGDE